MESIKLKSLTFPQYTNILGLSVQTIAIEDKKIRFLEFYPDHGWILVVVEDKAKNFRSALIPFNAASFIAPTEDFELPPLEDKAEEPKQEHASVHPKVRHALMGTQPQTIPDPDIVAKLEAKKPLPHFGSLHTKEGDWVRVEPEKRDPELEEAAKWIHENAEKEKPKKKKKRGRPRKK